MAPFHSTVKSAGMKISKICEAKDCKRKGIVEFYCSNCKLHLCIRCQQKEHSKHSLFDLEQLNEENKDSLKRKDYSNSFIERVNQLLDHFQKAIDQCRKSIEDVLQSNKDIYSFADSLYNTYECIKDIPNYHSINNILINNIDNILNYSNIRLMINIQYYFINSLNELNQLKK